MDWSVVVPVKVLPRAKSRLAELAGEHRERLALAMAGDTVDAALRCPRVGAVVVVTDDARAARSLATLGARVVSDEPDAGLNPALRHGARAAISAGTGEGVAALSADLPALRPAELARALDAAARHPQAFVPDHAGSGTTLYAAAPPSAFKPAFGPGSRDEHLNLGARPLLFDGIETVRCDVDTPADLHDAVRLGVGPRTAAIVAHLSAPRSPESTT